MIGKDNTYCILRLFFKFPTRNFQLRQISRLSGISLPAVISHVKLLKKEGVVIKVKGSVYDSYKANIESKRFALRKKIETIRYFEENVIAYLVEKLSYPSAIVLFGSAAKGEDIETSDIDLFVLASEKKINLSKWEKELNRKFNLVFMNTREFKDLTNKNKQLLNSLVNGHVLYGYLEVV